MPTLVSRRFSCLALLLVPMALTAQDVHIKKNISVGGNVISSSETSVKGARERTVSQSPTGNTVTIRQCDLKRTLTLNEQAQTYFVANDPQDDAAIKAAALMNGGVAADSGGTITVSSAVTDTGERKTAFGYSARHIKTTVSVEASKSACSQVNQKYEIDGWYIDLGKEFAGCSQSLPPIRQTEGCTDKLVAHHSGSAKAGYPVSESITFHGADNTTTKIDIASSQISKQTLEASLFDVPAGYRQVDSIAELGGAAQTAQAAASNQNAGGAAMQQAAFQQPGGAPSQNLGQKTGGKIRIGVAPPDAQVGQGNNTGGDYSTPIRNAVVTLMSGPAVEIVGLDSHIAMQLQAEAQQKQCDYILYSGVTVKHASSSSFGKFMKAGSMAANMTPMGAMAHGMGGMVAAQAAGMAASQIAQQQAMNQLAGFNGQIKSKDDVTVQYQLFATGQTTPKLQNSLQGKAKSDGEDVLTPLLQQTATNVLTEVSKK